MVDYLAQQGREDYWPHLDLVASIHEAFARHHGLTYIVERHAEQRFPWGGWDKLAFLIDLLARPDTGWVFWVDADALIVGDTDPRIAMSKELIGMARHPGPPEHYNCGVMFLRGDLRVVRWMRRVLERGPGGLPYYEQDIMNELLAGPEWEGLVKTLPHEWNSTVKHRHPTDCYIRAWHGMQGGPPARLKLMEAEIKQRDLPDCHSVILDMPENAVVRG